MSKRVLNHLYVVGLLSTALTSFANTNPASIDKVNIIASNIATDIVERRIASYAESVTYKVGQLAQGGVVVYVDESGQHGIVAALTEDIRGVTAPYIVSANARLQAYSKFGMGGGFQNTIQALAISGSANITSAGYVAAFAARYTTNYAGENTGNSCITFDPDNFADPNNCLAEWYVPNLGELIVMNNVLCGTPYALRRDITYLTSASPFGNTNMLLALKTPREFENCQLDTVAAATEVATNTSRSATVDVRYARQF